MVKTLQNLVLGHILAFAHSAIIAMKQSANRVPHAEPPKQPLIAVSSDLGECASSGNLSGLGSRSLVLASTTEPSLTLGRLCGYGAVERVKGQRLVSGPGSDGEGVGTGTG